MANFFFLYVLVIAKRLIHQKYDIKDKGDRKDMGVFQSLYKSYLNFSNRYGSHILI